MIEGSLNLLKYPKGERSAKAILAPRGLLVLLAVVVWLYLFAIAFENDTLVWGANLVGPLALGLGALLVLYRSVRKLGGEIIWTPYAWFLVAVVLFYCLGPLIYPLAGWGVSESTGIFSVGPGQLLRTNLLNTVGVLFVFAGFNVSSWVWGRRHVGHLKKNAASRNQARRMALIFLIFGGCIEYLVILPSQFGVYSFVLPGVIGNLGNLYLLGLMVLAYAVADGARLWRLPLIALWVAQIAVSILLFSKQQLVLSILLPPLGVYLARGRLLHLLLWCGIAMLAYFSASHFVLWGRDEIYARAGNIDRASLSMRLDIAERWFESGVDVSQRRNSAESGWMRLNYAPVQEIAMRRYDSGHMGDTLRYASIILIPRFIMPDKPVTTNMAVDFYDSVTGRRGSHLGLGIFGEGYWDYGWAGVIGLAILTGIAFSLLSGFVFQWMRRRAFEYMPCVFLGINMGLAGTTDFFVNSVLGATGLIFVYAVAARFIIGVSKGAS